jgi:hypothetical protein
MNGRPLFKNDNASDCISKISCEVGKIDRHLDFLEMVARS